MEMIRLRSRDQKIRDHMQAASGLGPQVTMAMRHETVLDQKPLKFHPNQPTSLPTHPFLQYRQPFPFPRQSLIQGTASTHGATGIIRNDSGLKLKKRAALISYRNYANVVRAFFFPSSPFRVLYFPAVFETSL